MPGQDQRCIVDALGNLVIVDELCQWPSLPDGPLSQSVNGLLSRQYSDCVFIQDHADAAYFLRVCELYQAHKVSPFPTHGWCQIKEMTVSTIAKCPGICQGHQLVSGCQCLLNHVTGVIEKLTPFLKLLLVFYHD